MGDSICKSILVVCLGNICRSPVAAEVLRLRLPRQQIFSAGLHAQEGHPVHTFAVEAARRYGVSLQPHYSQQVTRELCRQVDLILVMESSHIPLLAQIAVEARGKTMLFADFHAKKNIADPIGGDDFAFNSMVRHLLEAAEGWIRLFQK